ncbi:sensor histidine kinase [Paenibacillus endoradicis]|uniref:sensor histidine kinase n=1 Tax=Paenibacillus endoradicis TaxID=2972487 RepID=UPI002158F30F|nr:HAMP domain-containing sensor histidine kinase [Paenibacillus endoradicis]MCR8659625.1 HAMP domain-containing histidine kinase [Paenibacillus endoradicis]
MGRAIKSFRTKMLVLFMLSIATSALVTYGVYRGLQYYYHNYVYYEDQIALWRKWILKVGDVNFFLILFIPLAILMFYLLTIPYSGYFKSISKGIHHLANGEFSEQVVIETRDEFQSIAEDINRAGMKLQEAVTRGDFAESSKDQLVLNLAHDLRTPLTSVIGYLEYILQHEELSKVTSTHYTTIAYTKSKRLETLIEQLFEITRMNYGNLSLKKKPIDLIQLLVQLTEELYPIFESQQLEARVDLPTTVQIHGDGELLARVFENLLANAARYGNDGKYIDIVGNILDDHIEIIVRNYGDFIPQEELPFLFDMFYSGDRARTEKAGSTGLGLYIAKNIIEQHGGTILVQSDITATQFTVILPIGSGT